MYTEQEIYRNIDIRNSVSSSIITSLNIYIKLFYEARIFYFILFFLPYKIVRDILYIYII